MMMSNNKKMAMLIVQGLAKKDPSANNSKSSKEEKEESSETEEASMGPLAAMEEFIDAVHSKDPKAAMQALKDFLDMNGSGSSNTTEYVDSAPEGE